MARPRPAHAAGAAPLAATSPAAAPLATIPLAAAPSAAARIAVDADQYVYIHSSFVTTETPCVCTELRMATRSVKRLYDRVLSPAGLRVTGYSILSRLAKHGPLSVTELASMLAMERTTCTREVAPLASAGFISITEGTDRRRRLLRLTPLGEQKLAEGRPAWAQAQQMVAAEFGEADVLDLVTRLRRLLESSERLAAD
jgi:DNA-binding MarR family transcriptional regulator